MTLGLVQVLTGSTASATSVALSSWTPAANELLLVGVATRSTSISVSVSGNGLTWTLHSDVTNAQTQMRIRVYRALSATTPTSGAVTVTLTSNTLPAAVQGVRISGVDTTGTNGSGAISGTYTNAGPPTTDDADMKIDITTSVANQWALAFGTHRAGVFTHDTGETAISENLSVGTGGDVTSLSSWYEAVAAASTVTVGKVGSLNSVRDWSVVGLAIKPQGNQTVAVSVTLAQLRAITAVGQATGLGALAVGRKLSVALTRAVVFGAVLSLGRTGVIASSAQATATASTTLLQKLALLLRYGQDQQVSVAINRVLGLSLVQRSNVLGDVALLRHLYVTSQARADMRVPVAFTRLMGAQVAGGVNFTAALSVAQRRTLTPSYNVLYTLGLSVAQVRGLSVVTRQDALGLLGLPQKRTVGLIPLAQAKAGLTLSRLQAVSLFAVSFTTDVVTPVWRTAMVWAEPRTVIVPASEQMPAITVALVERVVYVVS